MNYAKRARLYLLRKKGKNISILVLVWIVSTFLLSCFSLLNASENLGADIRKSLGASFFIRASTQFESDESGNMKMIQNVANITNADIEAVLECGDISYYNPVNFGYAKGLDVDFIPGDKHTDDNNMGRVTALNYSALSADFSEETLALAQGRHIVEDDIGAIMISSDLAEFNNYSVGDKITLMSAQLGQADETYIDEFVGDKKETEVTIVGIYDCVVRTSSDNPTAGRQENLIFSSLDVLNSLSVAEETAYNGEVGFYISDPDKLSDTVSSVQQLENIDWNKHFIRTNDFKYSQIEDSLKSLGDLVKILLICVGLVSFIILTLILTLRVRGRIQEAGILLSIGISKYEILKQFLLEVFAVVGISFVLAYFTSQGVTGMLEQYLFADFQTNIITAETLKTGASGAMQVSSYLQIGSLNTIFIYLAQTAVIIVSILLSSVMVLRLKPKEILTKMS